MSSDWWKELITRWWPDDIHVNPTSEVRLWLESKRDVSDRIEPRSIGEIGVRAGYSAFAMLSAAMIANYLGFDVDSTEYGSEPGALDHGRKILGAFPHTMIVTCDSHNLQRLPPFDLLHIDGDHSYDGCTADLELAKRSRVRWALIDDYDNGDIVRAAVDDFAGRNALPIEHIEDGYRGSALINLC